MKKSMMKKVFSICMEEPLFQFYKGRSIENDTSIGEEMRTALISYQEWETAVPGQFNDLEHTSGKVALEIAKTHIN